MIAAANSSLEALGPRMLTDRHVTVERTATRASVTITGHSLAFIPGISPRIEVTSAADVERYVPIGGS